MVDARHKTYQFSYGQFSYGDTYDKYGVHLIGVGEQQKSRKGRTKKPANKIYKAVKSLNADICHFHDPELFSCGLKLKCAGKIVVFDSHENVSAQILDKTWKPKLFRKIVSSVYKAYETHVLKELDVVVGAAPHIAGSF